MSSITPPSVANAINLERTSCHIWLCPPLACETRFSAVSSISEANLHTKLRDGPLQCRGRVLPGWPVGGVVSQDRVGVEQVIQIEHTLNARLSHLDVLRDPVIELVQPLTVKQARRH